MKQYSKKTIKIRLPGIQQTVTNKQKIILAKNNEKIHRSNKRTKKITFFLRRKKYTD